MGLESVRAFLQANAPDIELIETDDSSSTVELAAKVHGVEPAQIAKTICLRVGDKTLLIVASGIARLDNRKVKDVLAGKAECSIQSRFLPSPAIPLVASARLGYSRPFRSTAIFTLRRFKEVVPGTGSGQCSA